MWTGTGCSDKVLTNAIDASGTHNVRRCLFGTMQASPDRPVVLHVVTHLGLGGAERVCVQIIRGLRESSSFGVYAANGIKDDAFGPGLRKEIEELRIPLHLGPQLAIRRGGLALSVMRLAQAVKATKPDIIHLHTEIPELVYSVLAATRPALTAHPAVLRTIHNSVYWRPRRPLGRWCERRMKESTVVAVSQGALGAYDELRRESGAGPVRVSPKIIYNGVEDTSTGGDSRENRSRRDKYLQLAFAGRLEKQKGADLLPEILKSARLPTGLTCELNVYGHGSYGPLLEKLQQEAPSGWIVRVNRTVPDFNRLLGNFDLVLMPSRYEGLGLVAVEALLSQVPVVATSTAGLAEVFPAGYPWLASPGDAASFARTLEHAIAHRDVWESAVADSLPFVQRRFDFGHMLAAYRETYAEVWADLDRSR